MPFDRFNTQSFFHLIIYDHEFFQKGFSQKYWLKSKIHSTFEDTVSKLFHLPANFRSLTHLWKKLIKKSEVPDIRFHDLRHTHATLMLKQGIHPKIVSE